MTVAQAPNGFLYSAADYYQINPNGYGISPMQNTSNPAQNGLQAGNPYAAGNPYGNVPIVWPNLIRTSTRSTTTASPHRPRPPFSSTITIALAESSPGASRFNVSSARILSWKSPTWANRGAFFPAPQMSQVAQNGLTNDMLKNAGLDPGKPADLALLGLPINRPEVQARFPQFRLETVNGQLTVPGGPTKDSQRASHWFKRCEARRSGILSTRSLDHRWARPGTIRCRPR